MLSVRRRPRRLKSASLSTRRFAAYAYFFEVAWRSNLDNHSRDRARACKTHGFHCHPLEPGKYATEIRGPRHVQLDFSRTQTTANWTDQSYKDSCSKWRLWPLRSAVSCTRDGADWPKVVAVGAQQPISDFFGFIQIRDTLSTNGEHHRVAEVKSFPAIPKSMRSVNGDQNGANLKKWSVLLVRTIPNPPSKVSSTRKSAWSRFSSTTRHGHWSTVLATDHRGWRRSLTCGHSTKPAHSYSSKKKPREHRRSAIANLLRHRSGSIQRAERLKIQNPREECSSLSQFVRELKSCTLVLLEEEATWASSIGNSQLAQAS